MPARTEPQRSAGDQRSPSLWRWLYSTRPALMPTVYVPGPVVIARKV